MNKLRGSNYSIDTESRNKSLKQESSSFSKNPLSPTPYLVVTIPEITGCQLSKRSSNKLKTSTINTTEYSNFSTINSSTLPILNEKNNKVLKPLKIEENKIIPHKIKEIIIKNSRKNLLNNIILGNKNDTNIKNTYKLNDSETLLQFKDVFKDVFRNNYSTTKQILNKIRKDIEEQKMINEKINNFSSKKIIFKSNKDLEKNNERKELLFYYVKCFSPIQQVNTGNFTALMNDGAYLQSVFKENTAKFEKFLRVKI